MRVILTSIVLALLMMGVMSPGVVAAADQVADAGVTPDASPQPPSQDEADPCLDPAETGEEIFDSIKDGRWMAAVLLALGLVGWGATKLYKRSKKKE